jgi:two-component sensor histidine kinase
MAESPLAVQPPADFYEGSRRLSFVRDTISPDSSGSDGLKALLAEKDIQLREVHHRIKNDMATIASYLAIQSDTMAPDSLAYHALIEARSRIEGMMRIYDLLCRSDDFRTVPAGAYIEELVEGLQYFNPEPERILVQADCENLDMDSKILFPLGMAVNELATNAIKHAFPGNRPGKVHILLRRDSDGSILAEVADDGIGYPSSPNREPGFGLTLVPALVAQIKGTLETTSGPDQGTTFRIRIPGKG